MNRITSSVLYSLTGAAMLSSLPSCKVKKESDGNEKKSMNIVYIMCDDHSFMGHRTKRILRIERKEYQTY